MYKILLALVGFIGASILAISFFSKSPEVRNTLKVGESNQSSRQIATSSEIIEKKAPAKPVIKQSLPPKIELPQIPISLPPISASPPPSAAMTSIPKVEAPALTRKLPPLDEEALLKSVVKIQCPTADGLGKYIGSGFVVGERTVVTAAHVVKDSASDTCEVIFPRERKPVHYLKGMIKNLKETIRRHDQEGIDVGVLVLPELSSYPEAQAIFSNYPIIPYPICSDPQMPGDELLHFGYPSNYLNQSYLSELPGKAVVNADINGVEDRTSLEGDYTYKSPVFDFTDDWSKMYPYMVSRVASFYGDSGGLAFNVGKQCIIGPHRGGTIGKAAGENYSVFMNLGWEKAKVLLP